MTRADDTPIADYARMLRLDGRRYVILGAGQGIGRQACHALAFDRVGPRHCGLLGRRAGSVPDYGYSAALKRSAIVWDEKSLDRFLAAPMKAVPGTSMTYDGIPDRQERADLIAYLRQVDQTPACRASASSAR